MRSKRTLIHRGYLYAQQHGPRQGSRRDVETSRKRMELAEAWRAGYIAHTNDARRKTK